MTKKDYIRIARALNSARPVPECQDYWKGTFDIAVNRLCSELQEDNPKFNPERFRQAVYGLKGGK